MPLSPILYSFRRCPYAIRARLALLVSGVAHETREIKLRDKPRALIAASPKATVPVLVLPDGTVIDQSLDIMRWALLQHDPERWLDADEPRTAALIATNDGDFKYHLDRYKYPEKYACDAVTHRPECLRILSGYEQMLSQNTNMLDAQPKLADMALLPFIRQCAAVDRDWFSAIGLPNLKRWLIAHTESALFQQAMMRCAVWDENA